MLITDAAFYLPISEHMLAPVLDDTTNFEDAVSGFGVPQIAALILLQSLPKFRERHSLAERALIETIQASNQQVRQEGLQAFAATALPRLDRGKIREGYELLAVFGIALLDDDAVAERRFLTPERGWDSTFAERYRAQLLEPLACIELPTDGPRILTAEQSRVFDELRAQADEPAHVQGYAGTGKSLLIKFLLTMLQSAGAATLVLTERRSQLGPLQSFVAQMERVHLKTFGMLVDEMITSANMMDPVIRRMRWTTYTRTPIADDVIERHLGVRSHGPFEARDLVMMARSAVAAYCFTGDDALDAKHVPSSVIPPLDQTTTQLVLHHAAGLWEATLLPPARDFQPPLRDFHRVKWAALQRLQIPAHYSHVIIDECHDLTKPMLQILDNSPQAVISLGDEYQNLQGRTQRRSNTIRHRTVTHSVRSGHVIERIVNPIIFAHPGETKLPFRGNRMNKTEVVYYDKRQVPSEPAVILTNDTWSLFEWAQRLAFEGRDFELLSSRDDLNTFVGDCIELHQKGNRPHHRELFRFGSWDALARERQKNQGFQRIERMLEKGYSLEHWMTTFERVVKQSRQGYALGLIEDVRNREFPVVMLVPEVVDNVWGASGSVLAAASSAMYVAVTRAQHRLIVPELLRGWIEEFSATGAMG